MSAAVQAIDISKLSESERLELIDVLWDSLDGPSRNSPLPTEQMAEIQHAWMTLKRILSKSFTVGTRSKLLYEFSKVAV